MRFTGFIGPSYTLRSVNVDCQRCVNLYPEINELQTSAEGDTGSLLSTPGLRLLTACGSGPIRKVFTASTGGMIVVSGSELYRIGYNWALTKVGDLLTTSGPVGAADNGQQLILVDGANGYVVSLATGVMTRITSAGFPGGNTVVFNGSYFIVNNPGTNQFARSASWDGLTWDALDFISAEANPDAVVAVQDIRNQVAVLGTRSVEFYWSSGVESTYSRIDGALIEYGCGAPFTVAKFANSMLWVGGGDTGAGIVWQADGYVPKRISNHGVETAIKGYGDIWDATAWVYQESGHAFYCLNFPNASTSWVYDISTGQWHERAYLGLDGNYQRHRAECYAFGFGEHVVGDYENGNLYALDNATHDDSGRPKKWMRRAPRLSKGMRRMVFNRFELDAQVGTGLDGSPANGIDPQVELRYSDDYGNTWSAPQARSLGKLGDYAKRVKWDRLGMAKTRVFEVSGSDPVAITILGAELDIMQAVS